MNLCLFRCSICNFKGTHGKMVNEKTRWPPYFFNLKNDFMEPGTSFRSKNWSSAIPPIKEKYKGPVLAPLYSFFIGAISELQFFDLKLVPGSIKSFSELKKYGGHLGFRIASLKLCFTMCALNQSTKTLACDGIMPLLQRCNRKRGSHASHAGFCDSCDAAIHFPKSCDSAIIEGSFLVKNP